MKYRFEIDINPIPNSKEWIMDVTGRIDNGARAALSSRSWIGDFPKEAQQLLPAVEYISALLKIVHEHLEHPPRTPRQRANHGECKQLHRSNGLT